MANKYDLKTWAKMSLLMSAGAANTRTNIGGLIPDGKVRFLTYIRATRQAATQAEGAVAFAIGSHTAATATYASTIHADRLKLPVKFPATPATSPVGEFATKQEIPAHPDIDHPLISVAGGNYMLLTAASVTAVKYVDVFAQYYDE